jgi:hypothetical protein
VEGERHLACGLSKLQHGMTLLDTDAQPVAGSETHLSVLVSERNVEEHPAETLPVVGNDTRPTVRRSPIRGVTHPVCTTDSSGSIVPGEEYAFLPGGSFRGRVRELILRRIFHALSLLVESSMGPISRPCDPSPRQHDVPSREPHPNKTARLAKPTNTYISSCFWPIGKGNL